MPRGAWTEVPHHSAAKVRAMPSLALDWGGVLVTDGSLTAWSVLQERLGIPEREAATLWQDELQVAADLGQIAEEEIWKSLASLRPGVAENEIREIFLSQYVEIPHAIRTISAAHAAGWQLVLATNNVRAWLTWWRKKYAWLDLFDEICCSSDLGVRKPDSEYYALLRAMMTERDGFFVDDKQVNVDAAAAAGFRAILADGDGFWSPPDALLEIVS